MSHTALDVQAIRRRAHERWIQRGRPSGSPELDWLEAELELGAQLAREDEPAPSEARRLAAAAAPSEARSVDAQPSGATPGPRRRRAPRSIVTSAASAPAARLLVALVAGAAGSSRR